MIEAFAALALVALTAAVVIGDASAPDETAPPAPAPAAISTPVTTSPVSAPPAPPPSAPTPVAAPRPSGATVDLLPETTAHDIEATAHERKRVATLPESSAFLAPDPERLIQTEVIVPAEAERSPFAVIRLLATIAGVGTLFGIGIVVAFRMLELILRAIAGG